MGVGSSSTPIQGRHFGSGAIVAAQAPPPGAPVMPTDLPPLPLLSVPRSPLVKAVLHTCRAMHTSLSGKADGSQSAFCHCERASGHLWSSLNVSGATGDLPLNHVSGGLSGPSGRWAAVAGRDALAHRVHAARGAIQKTNQASRCLSHRHRLWAQSGSLVSLQGSVSPPALRLGSLSPRPCRPGLCASPGQLAQGAQVGLRGAAHPCLHTAPTRQPPRAPPRPHVRFRAGSCGAL